MIPKVAHVIWIGKPMPRHLRDLVEGFEATHPDWKLLWWHEREIEELGLQNGDLYRRAPEFVPEDSVCQFRSDLARYEIVRRHGGMYLDCDFRWQRSVNQEIAGRDFMTVWEIQDKFAANGLFASVPDHPILSEMIEAIPKRLAEPRPNGWRSNRLTGTHVFTPIVRARGAYVSPQRLFCPIPWQRPDLASDPDICPDAIAVHIWNHQREIRGMDAG